MALRAKPKRPATTAKPMFVALLRGINVGGRNKLPMADLAAVFTDAGCDNVQTYIQSGNVVFRASAATATRIPTVVAKRIADGFGLQVPVVLRSADELSMVADNNPFLRVGADPAQLHVAFLESAPGKPQVAALDPNRSPPDAFRVRGREIYLHLPNGVARTKLTNAYLDTTLKSVSTVRNWRTVLKLVEMTKPSA